jgi:spore coat protein U-like protein
MSKMHLKQKLLGVLALAAIFGATEASAQATQNLNIQAVVPPVCIIDIATSDAQLLFNLSAIDTAPATFDGLATIAWRCTTGTALVIELDTGVSGDSSARYMEDAPGGNQIAYNLYTDNTFGTIWDDGTNGAPVAETGLGMGTVGNTDVNGRILYAAVENAPTGTYNDNITVTLTF